MFDRCAPEPQKNKRAPKRFCDRAVILLAICNWPKSVRMSIRRVRNPARQAKSRQEMWRARASTGLVLASTGRRDRSLRWMHSPRRKSPLEQPKQIGVTDVVPLHHQVYPRLTEWARVGVAPACDDFFNLAGLCRS